MFHWRNSRLLRSNVSGCETHFPSFTTNPAWNFIKLDYFAPWFHGSVRIWRWNVHSVSLALCENNFLPKRYPLTLWCRRHYPKHTSPLNPWSPPPRLCQLLLLSYFHFYFLMFLVNFFHAHFVNRNPPFTRIRFPSYRQRFFFIVVLLLRYSAVKFRLLGRDVKSAYTLTCCNKISRRIIWVWPCLVCLVCD